MFYDTDFAPYVPVAARRAQAQRKLQQLKKQGKQTRPVLIEGRTIATTFWGKAWCENLESYSDISNRLPRGRTYVRNGSVIDLQIEAGVLTALVSGSRLYEVKIKIGPVAKKQWSALSAQCAGKIDSVLELLTGKLSRAVMELLCRKETGLFPSTQELTMACSCPDGAWVCKHIAAVLYGVGARFDHAPELLFVLRGVDQAALIAEAGAGVGARPKAFHAIEEQDLSNLFGIELKQAPRVVKRPPSAKVKRHKRIERLKGSR